MLYKPKHPCRQPGCPNLTDNQVGYCTLHNQAAVLVHHKDRNPKDNDYDNMVALCIDCHAKEHGKDKVIRK